VSLVHATYILTIGGTKVLIAAIVEDTVSLMVANLPVVFMASLRVLGTTTEDDSEPPTGGISTFRFNTRTGATGATTTIGGTQRSKFKSNDGVHVDTHTDTFRLSTLPVPSEVSIDRKMRDEAWDDPV
jgi:hypothetical protein